MNTYIGIDLGTSSVKLLLMRADGKILRSAKREYPVSCPFPGYSEQDPEVWFLQTLSALEELLNGAEKSTIRGIGIAGQMHGLVLLDRNGNVIRPAILWNDGRSALQTERLNQTPGKRSLIEWTGNIAFAGFTAPKLLWVKENEPENYARIAKILLPKDYLLYRLCGKFVTDPSDACGTLYWNVRDGKWSEEMLTICGIQKEWLPCPQKSSAVVGKLLPELSFRFGLKKVYLVAGAGDNAAAAIGNGVLNPGICSISVGTSGTVLIPTDRYQTNEANAIHSFVRADGGYMQLGCILSASSCGKWWLEQILQTSNYAGEQKELHPETPSGLYFLPYLAGERAPHNDPYARGCFIGLRQDTSRAEMTQAVYEGVSFALRDLVEAARENGACPGTAVLCGGGTKSEFWPQMLSDILNMEIFLPENEEGPSLGGAILAAVGCNETSDLQTMITKCASNYRKYTPRSETVERFELSYRNYRRLYPALQQIFCDSFG